MSESCGKCAEGWICEQHPDQPWPHDDCVGPGMPCREPDCPYRINTKPVPTFTRLLCPHRRKPVATIMENQVPSVLVFLCPACGNRWSAKEPGI